MKPEILAMYLPQYHRIAENDEFWGEGFTDWVTVRDAQPLFDGHRQPRVPQADNYYDLSQEQAIRWQAKLAKDYGIGGFGIYHYWFNNEKNLLTKPAELILENKDIDIGFFFAWDNISWRRTWSNLSGNDWAPATDTQQDTKQQGTGLLIEHILGTEADWQRHFLWLLPYFQDSRYKRHDGKPIFVIFHYSKEIQQMCDYWNSLAQKHQLPGICFVFRRAVNKRIPASCHTFCYEPSASAWDRLHIKVCRRLARQLKISIGGAMKFDYDKTWQRLLRRQQRHSEEQLWPCAFVDYDDTPRRGKKGTLLTGGTPKKFQAYMQQLLATAERQGKQHVLLVAWNEWSEGAYLEPDTTNAFAWLEAIRNAIGDSRPQTANTQQPTTN